MKGQNTMSNAQVFQPKTATGRALLFLWDMVDISLNLHRTERWVRTVDNGLTSLLHAVGMAMLFIVSLSLAWYFDIESTIVGLTTIRNFVIPSIPEQAARITGIVIFSLTIAPTLMELLTAGIAKEDVKIIQIGIIAFTLFDLVTDIPRTYGFAMSLWPQFELLSWGISHISFWIFFFIALLFGTLGYELATVLFAYATIAFVLKSIGVQATQQVPRLNKGGGGNNNNNASQAVQQALKNIQQGGIKEVE